MLGIQMELLLSASSSTASRKMGHMVKAIGVIRQIHLANGKTETERNDLSRVTVRVIAQPGLECDSSNTSYYSSTLQRLKWTVETLASNP